MAAAQPNYAILSQSLMDISAEVALIPNAIAVPQQLQNLLNQMAQLLPQIQGIPAQIQGLQAQVQGLQGIPAQIQDLQAQIQGLQATQDLLPLRLHNATAAYDAPHRYPPPQPPHQLPASRPQTRQLLMTATIPICTSVATALGLPALPHPPTVQARRQQILDHLGCAVTV